MEKPTIGGAELAEKTLMIKIEITDYRDSELFLGEGVYAAEDAFQSELIRYKTRELIPLGIPPNADTISVEISAFQYRKSKEMMKSTEIPDLTDNSLEMTMDACKIFREKEDNSQKEIVTFLNSLDVDELQQLFKAADYLVIPHVSSAVLDYIGKMFEGKTRTEMAQLVGTTAKPFCSRDMDSWENQSCTFIRR